jgi:hypothetical protein
MSRPRAQKLALTTHIVSSVGWLGAVGVFVALALMGLVSDDPEVTRAAYVTMEAIASFVLVPLSLASLLSGVVQSLSTKWGLFHHYWVMAKLLINVTASIVLLLYLQTLDRLAIIATSSSGGDLSGLRDPSPLLHSTLAAVLLVIAAGLSVYKPRGMTRRGQRKQQQRIAGAR